MMVGRRMFVVGALGGATALYSGLDVRSEETMSPSAGNERPKFKVPANSCDAHFHIYDSRFPAAPNASLIPPDATMDAYLRLRERLGFERSVIVQPSTYGTDNSCMPSALEKLGARARGIAVVDTSVTDETLKQLDKAGVRGIRFNLGRVGATTVDMIEPLSRRSPSSDGIFSSTCRETISLPMPTL
ncbi:hypothetical protein GGD50_006268 [Rhizobium paranaense]|uniref:Amidohydrolase-related domain-containing protein n=1 Tax=Rhizobium paranaense TaxID=1650438 RepID=A0A7W8XXY7_9HYPH|nr:hypothetical protein [Rhizobium paranaense]